MRAIFTAPLFAIACTSSGSTAPDSAVADAPATLPCEGANPGVRIHVQFGFVSKGSTPLALYPGGLHLYTTGAPGGASYDLFASDLDSTYGAVKSVLYPPGTGAGPAQVTFYEIYGALGNWQGNTAFTADPTTCVDVDLFVPFVLCCGHVPDGGTMD
jgi:hypothetical protein